MQPVPFDVVVVGSANLDLAVAVDRPPARGETVQGGDVVEGPGGKGLNQAVACARLGLRTAFVGSVGNDEGGRILRATLESEGIAALLEVSDRPTGRALVLTDADGDSTITVCPGANASTTPATVRSHSEAIRRSRAVLVQHEIGVEAIEEAARTARGLFVLNPAPARPLPPDLLARCDVVVPNAHELAVLAGSAGPVDGISAATELATALDHRGIVVVTLGELGAVVVQDGRAVSVPARRVEVVDTTAAGDTFCAALVDGLLSGTDAVGAARWATRAAAITVTRPGAAGSVPRRDEIES